jgi:hypothetical protein
MSEGSIGPPDIRTGHQDIEWRPSLRVYRKFTAPEPEPRSSQIFARAEIARGGQIPIKEMMMKTRHIEPPTLCEACMELAGERARDLTHHTVAQACLHTRSFALMQVENGCIVSWTLNGPNLEAHELASMVTMARHAARRSGSPMRKPYAN